MRFVILISAMLAGCGVSEVATTAATAGKLQADQAKQGKEAMDKVQADLSAAMKAGEERAAKAESQQ